MSAERKLHITGDDFGYCPQRNEGIIECFNLGGVTDTSLLVNATYAKEAVELGLKHGLPMGLHFNVSEGKPVSQPQEVPSLLDDSGCFRGRIETMTVAEEGKLAIDDLTKELRAQIEKFKMMTGSYPRRIDGHQHVHIFPTIREAFAQVLNEYRIKITRIPMDLSLDQSDWMVPSLKTFLQKVAKYAQQSLELFTKCGIRSSDAFIGSSLMNFNSTSNLTLEHLQTVVKTVANGAGTIELMVHPGYPNILQDGGCGQGPDDFSKDICRKWELEFLVSTELKEYISKEGFLVQSWESSK